jgi:cytochrome c6
MKKFKKVVLIAMVAGVLTPAVFAASPEIQSLYKAKCNACHGPDGTGTPIGKKIGARDFTMPEIMKMTDAQLIESISKGKNKMPAFKDKLKESEIKDLVTYIHELEKKK